MTSKTEQPSSLPSYEYLIIGCSTWNLGELQSDWDSFFENLDEIDFGGKTVAYFGPRRQKAKIKPAKAG